MAEQRKDTGTGTTAPTSSPQNNPGGVAANQPDPARNVGNNSENLQTPRDSKERPVSSEERAKEQQRIARGEVSRNPTIERQQRIDDIMRPSERSGERERLRQSGRDPDTALPEDEVGEGNPSVETPDRIREKVARDPGDTSLQEAYRERDLTNGRQQTTDSHFRRDMVQEQMPKIPPSMIQRPGFGRMVDTPESVAQKQDELVYQAMRAPTPEELFELGVHPDQQDEKIREEMRAKGVRSRQEVEDEKKAQNTKQTASDKEGSNKEVTKK